MRHLACYVVLLVAAASTAVAQATPVPLDTSVVTLRMPSPDALARYRNDAAFDYDQAPLEEIPWWRRLWNWLVANVLEPVFGRVPGSVYRWLIYLVAAAMLFFAVTRLLNMSPRRFFTGTSDRPRVAFSEIEGAIAAMDFDQLINEATRGGDFRRAVRLHYLRVLQTLTVRGLIDWQIDKTNREYVAELSDPTLRAVFGELTHRFEYIWYGDFPIDEAAFERTRRLFAQFETGFHASVVA